MEIITSRTVTGALAALTITCALVGCNEKAPNTSYTNTDTNAAETTPAVPGDPQEIADHAAETLSGFNAELIESYKTNARKGLELINTRIDAIEAYAAGLTGQAQAEAQAAADRIKEQRAEYLEQLDVASADTADAWTQVKTGLENAWNELKDASSAAADEFGG